MINLYFDKLVMATLRTVGGVSESFAFDSLVSFNYSYQGSSGLLTREEVKPEKSAIPNPPALMWTNYAYLPAIQDNRLLSISRCGNPSINYTSDRNNK